ncbi:MAG: AAA family ATPase [Spirochaetes bacterium]|nr:AAA family ATPase [Spirochaetota bacterium]
MNKIHNSNIILLGGIYGSGKTGFALKYFKDKSRFRISRTEIRKLIFEMTSFGTSWSAEKFTEEDDVLVKHVERKILEHYIHLKRNILIVNTFHSTESRARFIKLAKDSNKSISIVFLDAPLEFCLKHNSGKATSVPDYVVQSLFNKKVLPSKKEGFDEVIIIDSYPKSGE